MNAPSNIMKIVSWVLATAICAIVCLMVGNTEYARNIFQQFFVRADIAAAWFLCAGPFTIVLVLRVARPGGRPLASTLVLACTCCVVILAAGSWADWFTGAGSIVLAGARAVLAVTSLSAVALLALSMIDFGDVRSRDTVQGSPALLVLLAAVACVVPTTFTSAVCQRLEAALDEALAATRVQRAYEIADELRRLDSTAVWNAVPISQVVQSLHSDVTRLQHAAATPLPTPSTLAEIGRRVTTLIQLDRQQAALELLTPLASGDRPNPTAADYCGLCCQHLERWSDSRRWYRRAQHAWQVEPASAQRTIALQSAFKGLAFAERRLNNPEAALVAYQAALALSPTAELHFLLAQFYEEGQETRLASGHALSAARMAPARYASRVQELMEKLSTEHFGCMHAYTNSRRFAVSTK